MHESALQQRSDGCRRWFMLSQNSAVNHPVALLYSSFGAPSTCQRTDCSSTQAPTPASVGESFFFFLSSDCVSCHEQSSRGLCRVSSSSLLWAWRSERWEGGGGGRGEEREGGWRMPRPGAARLGTLLIVITAAKCDAGVSRFSREAAAGIRTAASTTPQCYGRGGQEELNHVTL